MIQVLWNMTLFKSVYKYRCFGRTICRHLWCSQRGALKMEAAGSPKNVVIYITYKATYGTIQF
jgi:hypothetical protein